QLAGRWWRLFSPHALCDVALGDRADQRARRSAGNVLFPSMGARSRPAAHRGRGAQEPLSPLPESPPDGTAADAAVARFSLESGGPRVPRRGRMMEAAALHHVVVASAGLSDVRARPFAPADAARWEQFVDGCVEATFFHRIGWRHIIESVFHHRSHYLLAERHGVVFGWLPFAAVSLRLFVLALVSLPVCVYVRPAS